MTGSARRSSFVSIKQSELNSTLAVEAHFKNQLTQANDNLRGIIQTGESEILSTYKLEEGSG